VRVRTPEVKAMLATGEVGTTLRTMLRDLFLADGRGGTREKLARAHGYADGYMKALLDLGVSDRKELLRIVLEERTRLGTDAS
jgi:hypothetical protein